MGDPGTSLRSQPLASHTVSARLLEFNMLSGVHLKPTPPAERRARAAALASAVSTFGLSVRACPLPCQGVSFAVPVVKAAVTRPRAVVWVRIRARAERFGLIGTPETDGI